MKKGYLFILLTALVSGISIFLNKFGVSGINPYIFTWSKNILVVLFLFSLLIMFKEFKTLRTLRVAQWGKLVLIGLFGGSIPFLLFFKGLSLGSGSTASLMHKSMFVFVTILAVFFLKEKLNKGIVLGAALLFIGNIFLLKITSFSFGIAELLILSAVLLWSIETIISKHLLGELSSRIVAFGRMYFGVLFILAFLLITGNLGKMVLLSISQVGWIVFTSILLLLYVTTWYAGLKRIPASSAVCILVLGSAITTILSMVYSGSFTFVGIIGTLFILSGVIFVMYSSKLKFLLPSKN